MKAPKQSFPKIPLAVTRTLALCASQFARMAIPQVLLLQIGQCHHLASTSLVVAKAIRNS